MDPRFVATPSEEAIAAALDLWPELAGRRLRPLLVTAFGDIFVEVENDGVWIVDAIELACGKIAESVPELEALFADPDWAEERLITGLLLLAEERGVVRAPHQVFAVAPHPMFGGELRVECLTAMNLEVWHDLCRQFRDALPSDPAA
jgi:hypothetical protein